MVFGVQRMHGIQNMILRLLCVQKKIFPHGARHEFGHRLKKPLASFEKTDINQHGFDNKAATTPPRCRRYKNIQFPTVELFRTDFQGGSEEWPLKSWRSLS